MKISQGKCPHCPSSDAYTQYEDGGAWCFSCNTYDPPKGRIRTVTKDTKPNFLMPTTRLEVNDRNCPNNYRWLRVYLEDEEIAQHFKYIPEMDRHVFECNGYFEARSVDRKPKTISHGKNPFPVFGVKWRGDDVVIVEDVVSAIKVARQFTSMCLFGSHLPTEHMPIAGNVLVWLDADKYSQSMKIAKKINLITPTAACYSAKDPKSLTDKEIYAIVTSAFNTEKKND